MAVAGSRENKPAYFIQYVKGVPNWRSLKVLDFGCGQGEAVELMSQEGIECYGVDVFYAGDTFEDLFQSDVFQEGIIRRIDESGKLAFEDGFFDVIFSNQVFEHVEHKDVALKELDRVLKADGVMCHKFPTQDGLYEGHIGVPFVHWLPKGRFRYSYVVLMRRLGFGSYWLDLSSRDFAKVGLDWVDRYCFYEKYSDYCTAPGSLDTRET